MNIKINDLSFFPCLPNSKMPASTHGYLDAKKDFNLATFVNCGYNIAVACKPSGIIVLDLDRHTDLAKPDEELEALENRYGKLPDTLTQKTSGGGLHLIFSSEGIDNPIGKISANIDVKFNGYIMFAPSNINGNFYEIINGLEKDGTLSIASLPPKWVDFLNTGKMRQQRKPRQASKPLNVDIAKVFENCAFLKHCAIDAEVLSEPEWFIFVNVLANIEGCNELIHQFSEPYPEYSYEETEKKIAHARKFGHTPTCRYISTTFEYCKNCFNNKGEKNYGQ